MHTYKFRSYKVWSPCIKLAKISFKKKRISLFCFHERSVQCLRKHKLPSTPTTLGLQNLTAANTAKRNLILYPGRISRQIERSVPAYFCNWNNSHWSRKVKSLSSQNLTWSKAKEKVMLQLDSDSYHPIALPNRSSIVRWSTKCENLAFTIIILFVQYLW